MNSENQVHDVVVVGAGISGLSAAYRIQQRTGREVLVLEAGDHVGGTATTDRVGNFTIDRGPNGFLTNVSDTWMLAHELGIDKELRSASRQASRRFIYSGGRLHPLSVNPVKWAQSELLSVRGRMRAAFEPFIARERHAEESVWDFFARRFGKEFADVIASTAVIGITAGDARRLSMNALFPRLVQLEREHGSVVRGMVAKQLASLRGRLRLRLEDKSQAEPPPGGLVNFGAKGIQRLCTALADANGVQVLTGAPLKTLKYHEDGRGRYELVTSGDTIFADQVVLAIPATNAQAITKGEMPILSSTLGRIRYADVIVMTLGFENRELREIPRGYGFLVRRGEGIRMLGCQWTSSIFPEQVPNQHTVVRCMYGGAFDTDVMQLDRGHLLRLVQSELQRTMGIRATPVLRHLVKWEESIPQYEQGHKELVRQAEAAAGRYPGLHLAGNAYYGVAMNSCTSDADRVATEVTMELRGTRVSVPQRSQSRAR
jgi:oxygen-dependent protoporphyrinogen oxidase